MKGFLEVVHKNLGVVSTIFSPVKGSENRPQEGGHHTLKDSLKLRVEGAAKIVFQNFLSKQILVISIIHFYTFDTNGLMAKNVVIKFQAFQN